MRFESYLVGISALLMPLVSADLHTYCACQNGHDQAIQVYATQHVHDENQTWMKWAQKAPQIWLGHSSGPGPRWGGSYVQRNDGARKIDGDWMHAQCILYGGGESTCFECSHTQITNNEIECTGT